MTVAAATAAAWAIAVSPASAITAEYDVTDSDSGGYAHQFDACRVTSYGQGCFAEYGEWFSIEDTDADGKSPVIVWYLYQKDNAGDYTDLTRFGYIWHTDGNNTEGWQNKSFTDGLRLEFKLCLGEHTTRTIPSSTCTSLVATKA
ncbi:hypothetical protein ABZ446_00650 [Streptomyces sp. NPDC005813]|uniref:hypothetical protein n=1 Tax=Streptomyces sp. NPDC005813 TaxID=3155592 RepID=UPI0033FA1DB2